MKNLREEFSNENDVLIGKYLDQIEAELNSCISDLEKIQGLTEVDDVVKKLKELTKSLY